MEHARFETGRQPERYTDELVQYLRGFLSGTKKLLICFPNEELCTLFQEACGQLRAVPVIWSEDHTWKSLLKQAFVSHAGAIAGPAHVILGLTKLARATNTPLYIHDVFLWEESVAEWMLDGIQQGLDCRIWKCALEKPEEICFDGDDFGLEEYLLGWTSILDFCAERSEYGLSLEAVVFPGKKLPKFPSCARLVVRNWDTEADVPFAVRKLDLIQGKIPYKH